MKRSSALFLLATAAVAIPAQAFAYWQWRDANGRMVYSDVPPPPSVSRIVEAPGRFAGEFRPVEATPASTDAAAAKPSAKPAAASAPTAEEAFQKRREARLKADNEQATREREAAERQARCNEMRNYANGLQQGVRAAVIGPDGSLQHLDGDQRQAEMLRTNANLEKNCS
ncbi:DUF4124 domain-containing protein [Cupriavidus sp. IDO]|uniref:DUF4124 domain-containing protein n=1 Tax=Cupriavidus sp. IDO TaxID=1539142 RepID=UPI000578E869|nr:DUF4124 domain-containing protein [Cupriavidus sp. IDO]KWR91788.1 hypothetical protein RM96_02340 [Cupriavidus sp. IDO]